MEKRIALVIGNEAYVKAGRLFNPENDAKAMAATLAALGFDLIPSDNGAPFHRNLDKKPLSGR
ncbi:MAG: caspase family protein [Hyphomicrobiales bacterium]|nr:caspase family protein [Hyphomicrobiales bacterium]